MKRFALILGIALLTAPLAHAASLPEAWGAVEAGNYDQAIAMGTAQETADGYALAATAIIAKVISDQSEDAKDDSKQARELAEQAIALDPSHAEARLQYAMADGLVTRYTSTLTVWRKKLPQKTKAAIDTAIAVMPEDARADVLLGSWHLGIVGKAGESRAEKMFGASAAEGLTAFEAAMTKAPRDVVIATNYAQTLLAVDPETYGARAKELLESVSDLPPQTAIETVFQQRAKDLLANIDDLKAVKKMAEYFVYSD